ncbi:hypothetical protein FVE85_3125 [Porphyridium purpureum]|uniref:Large ribosomal subunit protein mL45 n=1 Tax=Porphyridium purpureum TaxID=35688 RepID=A0A5J4YVZ3_PORPP|nr:hypothetical protein FVE85_3125 [Porphyridium purpureum]|eukprot:POR1641..scf227_4
MKSRRLGAPSVAKMGLERAIVKWVGGAVRHLQQSQAYKQAPRRALSNGARNKRVEVLETGVVDPYKVDTLARPFPLTPAWWSAKRRALVRAAKSAYSLSKIQQADRAFSLQEFKQTAWQIYRRVNVAYARGDVRTLQDLCAPQPAQVLIRSIQQRSPSEEHVWQAYPHDGEQPLPPGQNEFLQARTFRLRVIDQSGKPGDYMRMAQITLRFSYERILYIEESGGSKKLLAGARDEPAKVTEVCVFMRNLSLGTQDGWKYIAKL